MTWYNPKYDRPESSAPPEERGSRLATFARGPDQELRVCLDEFKGHQFISLRVWDRGGDGVWRPVRNKGCSVRLAECDGLVEALGKVEGMMAGPAPAPTGDETPHYVEKRRAPRRYDPDALPPAARPGETRFDEFSND